MAERQKYVIGFTVHDAKDLSLDGVAIDPLVVVRAGGREYKTELKKGKLQHAKWEESHIWSDVCLTEEEFNMAFIDFELQSACVFTRNETVGVGRVQLAMVRRRPNHTYVHKTLQLSTGAQLTSKLTVTVFCYGEGESPPRPEDLEQDTQEAAAHLEDLGAAVLGREIQGSQFSQSYHLFVQVHRAEHLGGGDQLFNPYITVEFNGNRLESPPAKEAHTLNFDECFRLPVTTPLFADSIIIRVWDKKKWQSDEMIVQGRLSFSLLRMHALQPKWFNFYGFSQKEVQDVAALTSLGEMGEENTYQGRLLISGRVQKVGKVEDLHKAATVKGQPLLEPPATTVHFLCDVFEISGCSGAEAYVEMSIGKQSKKTKSARRGKGSDEKVVGRFRFADDRGRMQPLTVVLPTDAANQLDVMLSVFVQTEPGASKSGATFQRVGFVRLKPSEIKEWKGETAAPSWVSCRPMAHLPSSVQPGALLLSLAKSTVQVDDRSLPNIKALPFQLRCYVCAARGLTTQSSEVPSAFCQISCAGSTGRTPTIGRTSAPLWGECLVMPIDLQCSLSTLTVYPEPIQVTVFEEVDESTQVLQTETLFDLQKLGSMALQTVSDQLGDMTGDVLAKKRLGAVVDGKRVVGRVQVNFRKLLSPSKVSKMQPKWIKLKGGLLGSSHVGDLLIGFELLRTKYLQQFPQQAAKPPAKPCLVSLSLLGLRNITEINGVQVTKPKVQVVIPSLAAERQTDKARSNSLALSEDSTNASESMPVRRSESEDDADVEDFAGEDVHFEEVTSNLEWTSKPAAMLNSADSNRRWNNNGKSGFEFLNVTHMEVKLPKLAVWEPDVRLRLYSDQDDLLAEGRMSLAEHLPWLNPGKAKQAIEASSEYSDSEADQEGVAVSDVEDEETVVYVDVEIGNQPCKIAFNKQDALTFPPVVTAVAPDSPAGKRGLRGGDWLVAYKGPNDTEMKPTGHWKPAQAAEFIAQMDKDRVRPLSLRFRRKDKTEVSVRLKEGPTGLEFVKDASEKPPKIDRDVSQDKIWKKQGVAAGWRIVDINGFDTKEMSYSSPEFVSLLQKRPIIVTCRPHGLAARSMAEELALQETKPILLSGVPTALQKELQSKLRHRDGCMARTQVPRPAAVLPAVVNPQQLNLRMARGFCLDVQGVTKLVPTTRGEEGDERTRPSVPGRLEEFLPSPAFATIPLLHGGREVGQAKLRIKVVAPVDRQWMMKLQGPDAEERVFFEEDSLRRRFKLEQPGLLRVRTYVVRGLNVSGAVAGHGNPYLYFTYGKDTVSLTGHRHLATMEPRFFRTEERDVKFPEQSTLEVGLLDFQENGEDLVIGKTTVDLEDRWYTKSFQDYMKQGQVPVEYRPLMSSDTTLCKGSLEMWVEVLEATRAAEVPTSTLFQPPPVEVEIRVIVWSVRNLNLRLSSDDSGEQPDSVDVALRCSIDCKSFVGAQPAEQETDIHHGSEGNAEFNWRFVFSNVQVTKGAPLDCFVSLGLWEKFALQRPELLCESMIDMKNYCKKVAGQRELLQIEAELPLTNQKLTKMLAEDQDNILNVETDENNEEVDLEAPKSIVMGGAQTKIKDKTPPAAFVKVMVQVLTQTEASAETAKVGLGRNEPNRNPALTYPKSGRSWQYTLPTAVKVVEGAIEGFQRGRHRCKILLMVVAAALLVASLHWVKDPATGCPIIQRSCRSQSVCAACACCNSQSEPASHFCYYALTGSADSVCSSGRYKDPCNMASASCALSDGVCDTSAAAGICFSNTRATSPIIASTQSSSRGLPGLR